MKGLQRRFPRANLPDLEDATGYAIAELLDYWVHLPSSIDPSDPLSNRRKAVWFGVRRGCDYIQHAFFATSQIISADELPDAASQDIADHIEDLLDEQESYRVAVQLAKELDDQQFGWLKGYLQGLTATEEAAQAGVADSTIHRRRQKAMRALQGAAHEAGLVE